MVISPHMQDLYRNLLRRGEEEVPSLAGTTANFTAGALAGCTTLVIIYPLDIAHTRLAADVGKAEARQFNGMFHFFFTVFRKDGVRGIYRGLPASLHGMVVHRGLYFGGFDTAKEYMTRNGDRELVFWKRWAVAQAVATFASLASYPLDTVRRRMMMQSGMEKPMYLTSVECWRRIYYVEGPLSFYRGAVSNLFRTTGAALILVLYDQLQKIMSSHT